VGEERVEGNGWHGDDAFRAWQRLRGERVVKNERAFRGYNRRREDLERQAVDDDEPVPFVCECGTAECHKAISLSVRDYDRAHESADHYTVAPGHVFPEFEQVVGEEPAYWVVRKFGRPRAPSG
jgi:hypothetical protein